jgi:hypothetical protein
MVSKLGKNTCPEQTPEANNAPLAIFYSDIEKVIWLSLFTELL